MWRGGHPFDRDALDRLIGDIKRQRPVRGKLSSEWDHLLHELRQFIVSFPAGANDEKLISALIAFAAEFDDKSSLAIMKQCTRAEIGSQHSLWFSASALKYEHCGKYVAAVAIFLAGEAVHSLPEPFLRQQFGSFKKRMLRRLSGRPRLDLGGHHGARYAFEDGGIECRDKRTRRPCAPELDVLSALGYIPAPVTGSASASPAANRSDACRAAYDAALLLDERDGEQSLEEARLHAMGIDFGASRRQKEDFGARQKDFGASRRPREDFGARQDEFGASRRPREDFGARQDEFGASHRPREDFGEGEEARPVRSILKKREAPRQVKTGGVKFNEDGAQARERGKKRVPTPTTKRAPRVGESIVLGAKRMRIDKKLGENALMCVDGRDAVVIKAIPVDTPVFAPENGELFCLPIPEIPEFYATRLHKCGSFGDIMRLCHERPRGVEEPVAWFCLLEMVRIVRNLERAWVVHGEISGETLLNRFMSVELPKQFGVESWRAEGFVLCRCDRIGSADRGGGSPDRTAVSKLFNMLVKKEEIAGRMSECPRRWNSKLWNEAFTVLGSDRPLDGLIGALVAELSKENVSLALRSHKVRYNMALQKI